MEWNCFVFFPGAILAVEPLQTTLPVTTSLASLCSALIFLKHWFGEVRLRFLGFLSTRRNHFQNVQSCLHSIP